MAKTDADATRTAQDFADHVNGVLNRTVSRSRLSVVLEQGTSPPHFDLARLVKKRVTPLELNGTTHVLMFQHKIEVVEEHCATLTYTYRYQLTSEPESWVCRWEYFRKPPKPDYPYALSHVHVNAVRAEREKPVEPHEYVGTGTSRRPGFRLNLSYCI